MSGFVSSWWALACEALPAPVFVLGPLAEVLAANAAARRRLGIPPEWAPQHTPWGLYGGQRWLELLDAVREGLAGHASAFEMANPVEGSRRLRVRCRSMAAPDGQPVLLCLEEEPRARADIAPESDELGRHLRRLRAGEDPQRLIHNVLVVLRNALDLDHALFIERDHPRPGMAAPRSEAARPGVERVADNLLPLSCDLYPLSREPLVPAVCSSDLRSTSLPQEAIERLERVGARSVIAVEVRPPQGAKGFLVGLQRLGRRDWVNADLRTFERLAWGLELTLDAAARLGPLSQRLRWFESFVSEALSPGTGADEAADLAQRALQLGGPPLWLLLRRRDDGLGEGWLPVAHASRALDVDLERAALLAGELVARAGAANDPAGLPLAATLPARSAPAAGLELTHGVALVAPAPPGAGPRVALVGFGAEDCEVEEGAAGALLLRVSHWALGQAGPTARAESPPSAGELGAEAGRLIAGLVHDFNNILGIVTSYASSLESDLEPGHALQDDVRVILDATSQGSALLAQLARRLEPPAGGDEPVDLVQLLRHLGAVLERLFGAEFPLELKLSHDMPLVPVSEGGLKQLLLGLCLQAEAEAPRGASLLLRAEEGEYDEDDLAHLPGAQPGAYVVFEVGLRPPPLGAQGTDGARRSPTGGGLAPTGAAQLAAMAQEMGLLLSVDRGAGYRAELALPLTGQEEHRFPTGERPAVPGAGDEAPTLLLIDDEPHLRTAGERNLARWGYQVLTAPDGEIGLRLFRRFRDRISGVVLDLIMPGMDGRATYRALRALDPSVPVVIASGFATADTREQLLREGVAAFVAKPYSPKDIHRALGQARARQDVEAAAAAPDRSDPGGVAGGVRRPAGGL